MKFFSVRRSQSGDTIVEVVLALTVISLVLGSASALANRNTRSLQTTQEHAAALRLAQSQLEQLKVYAADHEDELKNASSLLNASTGYCMTWSGTISTPKAPTDAKCKVDASGAATTAEPAYAITIKPVVVDGGYRAQIAVEWTSLGGQTEKVELLYRTYDKLAPTKAVEVTCTPPFEGTYPSCVLPVHVSPASYDFPAWHLGVPSILGGLEYKSQVFTVSNSSTEASIRLGTTLLTDTTSSFTVTANNCQNAVLSPGGHCSITVAFTPATGDLYNKFSNATKRQATLTINNLDSPTASVEAPLEGKTYSSILASGEVMKPGDVLRSINYTCYNDIDASGCSSKRLEFQNGGNIVLKASSGGQTVWYTDTGNVTTADGRHGNYLFMQPEGNLVLYNRPGSTPALWATNMCGGTNPCIPLPSSSFLPLHLSLEQNALYLFNSTAPYYAYALATY